MGLNSQIFKYMHFFNETCNPTPKKKDMGFFFGGGVIRSDCFLNFWTPHHFQYSLFKNSILKNNNKKKIQMTLLIWIC